MDNPTAAQAIQNIISTEQQLLARKALAAEAVAQIDDELARVRSTLQGIQLGQRLAEELNQETLEPSA